MMESAPDITAHLTTGAVVVYLIEWAKRSKLIPISASTTSINRALNVLLAAAVALGINWSFDATAGTLVITGLTWPALGHAGWEFLKQLVTQQILYDGVLAPKLVKVPTVEASSLPTSGPPRDWLGV